MLQKTRNGFTLIEVLVALAILALGLVVVMAGLHTALQSVDDASEQAHAVILADTILDEYCSPNLIRYGTISESTDDGFHWKVVTTPMEEATRASLHSLAAGYQVDITITKNHHDWRFLTLHAGRIPESIQAND